MNSQTLQTAKIKQVSCPLSSEKEMIDLCIKDSCFAFIPSVDKCFYLLAAGYGIDIIKSDDKAHINSQPVWDLQNIFRDYYDRVFRIAYRILRNRDSAEDITQEVFIRAYKNASMISPDIPLAAWLYRVTTNLCLDELRRRKIIQIEPCADFDIKEIHRKFRFLPAAGPEEIFDEKESMVVIDRVLKSLPSHYCQALLMKCVDELSYEDIAYAMDTTIAGVRSIIFRARKQFIKLYSEFAGKC